MKSAVVIQLQPPNAAQYSLYHYLLYLFILLYSANKSLQFQILKKQRGKKSGDTHTFVHLKSYLERN